MIKQLAFVMVLFVAGLAMPLAAHTESAAYFRSTGGVATADEQPLPHRFDTDESLIWKTPLPAGHSSPCVSGNAIYLTTYDAVKEELATVALDRNSGKVLWKRPAPTTRIEPFHRVGSPAASTPACDGKRVYVFFGSYGLLCYDLEGVLQWSKELGPFQDEFGASSSPVVVDGKVILNEDHDVDSFLIAFNAATGDLAWRVPRDGFTRSYASPMVWEVDGRKELIVAGALQLNAHDIATGQRLWWVNGLSRIMDTTPAQANGLLYVASWTPGGDESERIAMGAFSDAAAEFDKNNDGKIAKSELIPGPVLTRFFRIDLDQDLALDADEWAKHARVFELAQNVAVAIRPGGKGDVTDTHVKWTHRRGLPTVPSPLVYRDVVYMMKDGGRITSLDAETGEPLKQGRARATGNYYASPVAGDGKVYFASEKGVMTVLEAGRRWKILDSHEFGERIMATPTLTDGRIYLRTDDNLYCFGIQ